ncbi:MAG: hypothetical protein QM673_10665 [Gordonia sp. (in: high G+C Gram-positive bacteria)]
MRVYFPATLAMLMELADGGEFRPISGTGFAVTPALRESYASGDDEELAEAAIREAARASLRLLAVEAPDSDADTEPDADTGLDAAPQTDAVADPDAPPPPATPGDITRLPPRRAVVAADVASATLHPELDDAVVRITGTVPLSAIASVLVDGADAEDKVRVAMVAIDAADLGDQDAELAVGDIEDHDLGWYATQELPFLLELL